MNWRKVRKRSQTKKNKFAEKIQINGRTINDTFIPVKTYGMESVIEVISVILESSLTNNNLQYATLDVPMDADIHTKDAVREHSVCLLFGKIIINEKEVYLWVSKNFRQRWMICGSYKNQPETIFASKYLYCGDTNNVRRSVRFILSNDYFSILESVYAKAVTEISTSS